MKKTLSLLLCLFLTLSVFVSCNNDEVDTSSENSETSEISETSGVSQEIQIPEKVVYFTGKYHEHNSGVILESPICEIYSGSLVDGLGLKQYLETNVISDDTYFLVGAYYFDKSAETIMFSSESIEDTRAFLKNYDFIEIDNYFTYDFDYGINLEEHISSGGDRIDIDASRIEAIFPEFDGKEVLEEYPEAVKLCFMGFDVIGYISAGALRDISEHEFSKGQSLSVTWFPAPDDQRRWLTFDPDYKEQQEVPAESK